MKDHLRNRQLYHCLNRMGLLARYGERLRARAAKRDPVELAVELASTGLGAAAAEFWQYTGTEWVQSDPEAASAFCERLVLAAVRAGVPVQADWRRRQAPDPAGRGIASSIAVKVAAAGEQPSGALVVHLTDNQPVDESGRTFLSALASYIAVVLATRPEQEQASCWQSLMQSSPDPLGLLDQSGQLLDLNRAARELLGLQADSDAGGYPIDGWMSPRAMQRLRDIGIKQAQRSGFWSDRAVMRSVDGGRLPVELRLHGSRGEAGNAPLVFAARPLLEETRSMSASQGRERLLRSLVAGRGFEAELGQLLESLEITHTGLRLCLSQVDADSGKLRWLAGWRPPEALMSMIDDVELGPGSMPAAAAAYGGSLMVVQDIQADPDFVPLQRALAELNIRAVWALPMRDRAGAPLAVLSAFVSQSRAPDGAELEQLEAAAEIIGLSLQHAKLDAKLQEVHLLHDSSPALLLTLDAAGTIMDINGFGASQLGYTAEELRGMQILRLLAAEEHTLIAEQLAACLHQPGLLHRWQACLVRRSGERVPVQASGRRVDVSGEPRLLVVLEQATAERAQAPEQQFQASHDPVTGLVNRNEFERRLARALARPGVEHALCFLNLDHFKVVNEVAGHVAGDELLRQIGSVLSRRLRQRDTLGRSGDDNFLVLLEHCDRAEAVKVAEELRRRVEEFRFVWDGRSFNLTASVGLAGLGGETRDVGEAMIWAEVACHSARDSGRNRVYIHHVGDSELARRYTDVQWATRLRKALADDRLQLLAQPVISADGQLRLGELFEIFVRLKDVEGEAITPGAFMKAAEQFELSVRLDRWVLQQTLAWLRSHPDAGGRLIRCQVNLSRASVQDRAFPRFALTALERAGVPASKICFEVNEKAAFSDLRTTCEFMHELKAGGCRLALDDFGSGLSSFGYLRELPVDIIKIAGSVVSDILDDPVDLSVVSAVNEIGHLMGRKTHAMCVENVATLEKVRNIGVDFAQGYAIGRPQPLDRLH